MEKKNSMDVQKCLFTATVGRQAHNAGDLERGFNNYILCVTDSCLHLIIGQS